MDIEMYYDEETEAAIKKYEEIKRIYEADLRKLIDNTPYLGYRERNELFTENCGRLKLEKILTNLRNRIPKSVLIVGCDKIQGV